MQTPIRILACTLLAAFTTQPARPERVVFGDWRVTGSFCPSQCAISRADAESWRGRTATYAQSAVRFAENSCKSPRYGVSYWPASGVYGGARLVDMGIAADSAMVIEVRCADRPQTGTDPRWQVAGAFLIVKDRDHLLTVWENVFFELTRQ